LKEVQGDIAEKLEGSVAALVLLVLSEASGFNS